VPKAEALDDGQAGLLHLSGLSWPYPNEAQFYLDVADGGLGERVAAGLRELRGTPPGCPACLTQLVEQVTLLTQHIDVQYMCFIQLFAISVTGC
jgi:hypothetical protein